MSAQPERRTLTSAELRELTGCVHRATQKRVLDQHGIGYLIRADGSLVTTWEAVNAALCGGRSAAESDPVINTAWMGG